MLTFARIFAAALGFGAAFLAFLSMRNVGFDPIAIAIQAVLSVIAIFALWFAWQGGVPAERAKIKKALSIGAIVGGVAFLAGYVGPVVLAPGASQGPLLGIFITGPAGFVLGSIAGILWVKFFDRGGMQ